MTAPDIPLSLCRLFDQLDDANRKLRCKLSCDDKDLPEAYFMRVISAGSILLSITVPHGRVQKSDEDPRDTTISIDWHEAKKLRDFLNERLGDVK